MKDVDNDRGGAGIATTGDQRAEYAAPDYTAMDGPELLAVLRDDGSAWAAAFCQHAKKLGIDYNEGWMLTWFCNAIENSWDVRVNRAEPATRPVFSDGLEP